jgi:hypothetical protein
VGAMAVGTVGDILDIMIMGLPVPASQIYVENFGMAGGAIHRLIRGAGARQMICKPGMAFYAIDILMNRIGEHLLIHKRETLSSPTILWIRGSLWHFMQSSLLWAYPLLVNGPGRRASMNRGILSISFIEKGLRIMHPFLYAIIHIYSRVQ